MNFINLKSNLLRKAIIPVIAVIVILFSNFKAQSQSSQNINSDTASRVFTDKWNFNFSLIGLNGSLMYNFGRGFVCRADFGPDYLPMYSYPNYYILDRLNFTFDFRYYPFAQKRVLKAKNIIGFPGTYIASLTQIPLRDYRPYLDKSYSLSVITLGHRAVFAKKRMYFDFQIGAGPVYSGQMKVLYFGSTFDLGMGFIFRK